MLPAAAPDLVKQRQAQLTALRQRANVTAPIEKVGRIQTLPTLDALLWL